MKAGHMEESDKGEDDEFDVGEDKGADGKVNIPVSHFESKFIGNKEEKHEDVHKDIPDNLDELE